MTHPLCDLGLPQSLGAALSAGGLPRADDAPAAGDVAVATALRASLARAREVGAFAGAHAAPRPADALSTLARERARRALPLGVAGLDRALRGGLPPSVTEVCGAAGAGKTQLCLTATAAALAAGGRVVFLDTEASFSPSRLRELLAARFPQAFGGGGGGGGAAAAAAAALARVSVFSPRTLADAVDACAALEEHVLAAGDVRLVVVDSVAALARRDFDGAAPGGSMAARAELLLRLSSALKALADVFSLPILLTNQVTTRFAARPPPGGAAGCDAALDAELTPALGPTWAHAVNTRLLLGVSAGAAAAGGDSGGGGGGASRTVTIVKSSCAPVVTFAFRVGAAGLLDDDGGGAPGAVELAAAVGAGASGF
jgi:RAD51-like protein 1